MKFNDMKLRYKVAAGVATSAAVLGMAGGAFAYFTAGGSGSSQGAVGSPSNWTVTVGAVSSSISPGQGSETFSVGVTNPGSGNQELSTLSVAVNTFGGAGSNKNDATANGVDIPGCLASWFVPVIAASGTGTTNSISPNVDVVPTGKTPTSPQVASYSAVVTMTMTDAATSQNACQGAAPDITVSAS